MSIKRLALLVALLPVLVAGSGQAAPGDLDTTYGSNGLWTDSFATLHCPGFATASGMKVLSNGEAIVVGSANTLDFAPCTPQRQNFLVAKITASGALDDHFGDDASVNKTGWTETSFVTGNISQAAGVAVQSDGKIVVVGTDSVPSTSSSWFAIARYNSDGTLDTSFAQGCTGSNPGTLLVSFPGSYEGARAVGIDSAGRIVVAGATLTSTANFDMAVARLTTGGCPDTTFGPDHNGKVVLPWAGGAPAGNDWGNALLIQGGDKIVVGGRVDNGVGTYDYGFGLLRLTSAGDLDTTFGLNGYRFTSFGDCNCLDGLVSLVAQPDGKMVAAGEGYEGAAKRYDFALARYSQDGAPDMSFGTNGTVTTDFAHHATIPDDYATSVTRDSAGRIDVGGYSCCDSSGHPDVALARYTPAGDLDTSFGTGGKVLTDISSVDNVALGADYAFAIGIQPTTGKLLVAGQDTLFSGTASQDNDAFVARYLAASADGVGTMSVTPAHVRANTTGNTLALTYTAPAGGLTHGAVQVVVPAGWSAPSTNPADPGYVSVNYGFRSVSGQTITVSSLSLAAGAKLQIVYGAKAGGGPGATSPANGIVQTWLTKEKTTATGTLTNLASGSPSVDVLARDGSGTMSAAPTKLRAGSSGNTLTFVYNAAAGGTCFGGLTLAVPAGWSAPSTTGTAAGYTTSTAGTVSVSGHTIVVSSLDLAGGAGVTIVYGSKASGGPGASAPATGAVETWTAKERSSAGITPVALAASPAVDVLAADGSGTLTTPTTSVVHSSMGNTITFTYTVASGGISGGIVTVTVPSGWSAPSTTGTAAGYATSSAGTRSVSGQTIVVSGLTLTGGSTFQIVYGSKAGGGPGATAPGATGAQTWTAKERSSGLAGAALTALASSPVISVG